MILVPQLQKAALLDERLPELCDHYLALAGNCFRVAGGSGARGQEPDAIAEA